MMTDAIRDFIRKISIHLKEHEKKRYAKIAVPYQKIHTEGERIFYSIKTNVFNEIIFKGVLIEALKASPEKFGTGNAKDVIDAIYKIEPVWVEDFTEFLREEQFCWVVESVNGEIAGEVLRIDLFRKFDSNNNLSEFTGGIFHALKHFSYNGVNLSIGKEIKDISTPEQIVEMAINAFFLQPKEKVTKNEKGKSTVSFTSFVEFDEKYNLKFVFYKEEVTGIFFIKTIHTEKK